MELLLARHSFSLRGDEYNQGCVLLAVAAGGVMLGASCREPHQKYLKVGDS